MIRAITFDAGQTLVRLDNAMLSARLGERGHLVSADALDGAEAAAWRDYHRASRPASHGAGPHSACHSFMAALLGGAGIAEPAPLVAWLWSEQPRANLWRRPVPGMIELAAELVDAGLAVGVLSNSEG